MSPVKLSQGLKSLINLPSAVPTPLPAPPAAVTAKLFDSIRSAAPASVSRHAWLTLGTAALVTLNSPDTICQLWDYAGERKEDAEVMREVGLKCISLNGIPRTINALGAFQSHLPEDVRAALPTQAYRRPDPSNVDGIAARSRKLWDAIYTPHHDKLLNKLARSHPDLPVHILHSHYGPLLANPPDQPQPRVGRILTSIIAITCLRAQRGVGPQVTSHVFGLLKAATEPGAKEDVEGGDWLTSEEGAAWVLQSTDKVTEMIANGQGTFAVSPPGSPTRR
ncbi:hypothetical protein IAU60_006325 [Kwoniella sp. DSM 27419]